MEEDDSNEGKSPADKSGYYYVGYIYPRSQAVEKGLSKTLPFADPRYYSFYELLGDVPLDERLLDTKFRPTYLGEEKLYGSHCAKIETSFGDIVHVLYWIDIEHGFLLRRREERVHTPHDYLLEDETTMPRIQQSHGIWCPAIVEEREFLDRQSTPPGQSPQVDAADVVFSRTTISSLKANSPIPASTFVMKWPKGTNVHSEISQKNFVAGGNDFNAHFVSASTR